MFVLGGLAALTDYFGLWFWVRVAPRLGFIATWIFLVVNVMVSGRALFMKAD